MHPSAPPRPGAPEVLLLLAVCNGGRHLGAQLDSIAAQRGAGWRLLASDDGSTDDSRALLARFADAHPGRVRVLDGPQAGSTANFCHLIAQIPADAGHVGFCDQDDVWLPGKLSRAVAMLSRDDDGRPALYASRTTVVDEALNPIGESPGLRRPASFRNALVQNIASGNTMLLSPSAAALARAAVHEAREAMGFHDWWAYQLVTGAGGRVVFDDRPSLLYRQHRGNVVGAGIGRAAAGRRAARLLRGAYRDTHLATCRALAPSAHRLTAENRAALADYCAASGARLPERLRALRRARVYYQTRSAAAAFWLAALFDRV